MTRSPRLFSRFTLCGVEAFHIEADESRLRVFASACDTTYRISIGLKLAQPEAGKKIGEALCAALAGLPRARSVDIGIDGDTVAVTGVRGLRCNAFHGDDLWFLTIVTADLFGGICHVTLRFADDTYRDVLSRIEQIVADHPGNGSVADLGPGEV